MELNYGSLASSSSSVSGLNRTFYGIELRCPHALCGGCAKVLIVPFMELNYRLLWLGRQS